MRQDSLVISPTPMQEGMQDGSDLVDFVVCQGSEDRYTEVAIPQNLWRGFRFCG